MAHVDPLIDHLLRRAGFGAGPAEVEVFRDLPFGAAVAHLVDFHGRPDDVDARIGRPDHAQIVTREAFSPDTDIDHARQRWLFRMIHTRRPLQVKMALFWHNHFATAYGKLSVESGGLQATKMMAHAGTLRGPMGQLELFREHALSRYRDLLLAVARDPAMLVWLDGQTNTRERPQENFGREVMELFSVGVGHYTEADVYAAARVFTGWNLLALDRDSRRDPNAYRDFVYRAEYHDTDPKTFSFPIYVDGARTIPSRAESAGQQDGVDLIAALAAHPETARRLARKFWSFFVSEVQAPPAAFVEAAAAVYLRHDTAIAPMVNYVLVSPWFTDLASRNARYAWPPEYVVRAIKEVGWQGLSLEEVRAPMANMGVLLFEPPDVGGWSTGAEWFSTGTMLARTNFAAALAGGQKAHLAASIEGGGGSPQTLLDTMLDRLTPAPLDLAPRQALVAYLGAGSWRDGDLDAKIAGLARLIVGSSEYQLV
jgi:uncharacterized protein (DUF1800 family)